MRSVIVAMDDPEELPRAAFQAPWDKNASTGQRLTHFKREVLAVLEDLHYGSASCMGRR